MLLDRVLKSIPNWLVGAIYKYGDLIFGRELKIHRIPFGPLRNQKIFIRFSISPRMYFGVNEPWVTKMIRANVKPGDVVYDLGAHIGYTCLVSARSLKGSGFIHAFEIVPSNANILKNTIEANHIPNVTIHNVGVADREEILELPVGATCMTSIYSTKNKGVRVESCKIVTLDGYVLKHGLPFPDFIKIDVEGAEVACLTGGKVLIHKTFPRMVIEFHSLDLLKQGYSLLDPWGYVMYLQSGEIVNQRLLDRMNQLSEKNVLCLPDLSRQ